MMLYSLPMVSVATYEKRIRANAELTSDAKLVLISILDLDDVRRDVGSIRPLDVSVRLVASGCGLNDARALLAMCELERLGLIGVEHVGGQLDLRVDPRYEAIDMLLGAGRAGGGGRGPRGGGGGSGSNRIRSAVPAQRRLRGTGSDGEVRIVPVDYLQSTSPTVESQHPEAA
jgi:hypothetical protein